jgi:hypothetical protein
MTPIDTVVASLSDTDQPHALFRAVDAALKQQVGHILFTILISHHATRESERFYTNMPEAYPVGGKKPITDSALMQRLLVAGEPYIGHNADDIRWAFYDHELIRSLGCDSVLNMPVRWQGRTIGTLNLLAGADHYNNSHIPIVRTIAHLALPGMLMVARPISA